MISIDMGRNMGNAFRSMAKFDSIAKKLPLEKLMGLIDGIQESSGKGRFDTPIEPLILWGMRDILKERIGEVENLNLTNYFSAYVNGYLFYTSTTSRFLDRIGKEKTKYECALTHLEIPRIKDGKYFRTKNNIYENLDDRKLLIYDDRSGLKNRESRI